MRLIRQDKTRHSSGPKSEREQNFETHYRSVRECQCEDNDMKNGAGIRAHQESDQALAEIGSSPTAHTTTSRARISWFGSSHVWIEGESLYLGSICLSNKCYFDRMVMYTLPDLLHYCNMCCRCRLRSSSCRSWTIEVGRRRDNRGKILHEILHKLCMLTHELL